MATLCKYPCFLSLSTFKPLLTQQRKEDYMLSWKNFEHPSSKHFSICACSARKSRGSRRVKSNTELCKDIREFLAAVGLPEGHIPSMKELSLHGRTDLANIVRRRGYKVIRDLLLSSTEADIDGSAEKILTEGQDESGDNGDTATGQNKKVMKMTEGSLLSTEESITQSHLSSVDIDPEYNSGGFSTVPVESSVNFLLEKMELNNAKQQNQEVKSMVENGLLLVPSYKAEEQNEVDKHVGEENFLSTSLNDVEQQDKEVSAQDDCHRSLDIPPDPNIVDNTSMSIDVACSANSSLAEMVSYDLGGQQEKANDTDEGITLSTGVSHVQNSTNINNIDLHPSFGDHHSVHMDSTASLSLQKKVDEFILNGDLDAIEDDAFGVLIERSTEERNTINEPEKMTEIQLKTPSEENIEELVSRTNSAWTLNGSALTSTQVLPSTTVTNPFGNDHLSAVSLASDDLDKELDIETNKRENQVEINDLKFMLRQKELELSKLMGQIEKEKYALSVLQTRAETEIRKAQQLISEKDAELLAAAESLSGLAEVKIEYSGDGEVVEMAGSFNGWHHWIKMDPQPPSPGIVDPVGSRRSRLWSTMLWLYPGAYEIKFIVDGHWKIDPRRETVMGGGFCNNILRVDR